MAFQCALALRQPAQQLEAAQRLRQHKLTGGLGQQVGLDECAVEVNDERVRGGICQREYS